VDSGGVSWRRVRSTSSTRPRQLHEYLPDKNTCSTTRRRGHKKHLRPKLTAKPYTSAANTAGRISERRSAAKAKWEADKCGQHFGYRLKGKAGTKRPIPMTSVKSLAARFYRLKSGHAPTAVYLKRFGHREDDKCWWCGGGGRTAAQMREHLFCHCSRWREQQKMLWKVVGKATGWKAGRCRHVRVSELFSRDECDQAVMDFVAATEVGKFPPK